MLSSNPHGDAAGPLKLDPREGLQPACQWMMLGWRQSVITRPLDGTGGTLSALCHERFIYEERTAFLEMCLAAGARADRPWAIHEEPDGSRLVQSTLRCFEHADIIPNKYYFVNTFLVNNPLLGINFRQGR